jgi:Tol biopolymer transport system component
VEGNCSGCHSLSRAGTRIGYSRCVNNNCGPEYIGFLHYDAGSNAWTEVVDADSKALAGSYTTFAPIGNPYPDDTQSVAIVTLTDGSMGLYDPDTGSAVASNLNTVSREAIDGTGAAGSRTGMMPDWSADGTKVVFASTPNAGAFVDLDAGSIAMMSYQYNAGQHVFGSPTTLVTGPITLANGTYENLFFPSFSPDGKLVVFNAARAAWRDLNAGLGRTPGQRLMLADAAGSGYVDLTALNGGMTDLDVTWPHWAPGATNDYYWIVFSSERDYGHEITQANTAPGCVENGMLQCKQIWIGAISKAQLAAGLTVDPSAPPMWLPGQDPQADNISPYWTRPAGIQ